ncbi:hypothetical protein DV713_01400 [Parageobacillus thermoglucosidasius]|uniref:hypothetical protein n=1 Tax=Parageobacillus thermoglucosidasius TaxID=1426 RepID=UPI000E117B42|nr:hypothetical protein [Parageobacillus thermoglucosidasius]RDE36269.1 hypothetical protein DV713_01400 [Parageobacillus thermoglucosidasius]
MGMENLEEFLTKKKEQAEKNKIDWEQKKQQWLMEITTFYKQIQSFLTPLQEKGLLSFEWEEVKKYEEYLGEYTTRKLYVNFPDQQVVIEPIGKNIIGAMGRIDMIGKNGNVMFLLVDKEAESPKIMVHFGDGLSKGLEKIRETKNPEYAWKIATPPPNIKFIDLNKDSFSDALLGVIAE